MSSFLKIIFWLNALMCLINIFYSAFHDHDFSEAMYAGMALLFMIAARKFSERIDELTEHLEVSRQKELNRPRMYRFLNKIIDSEGSSYMEPTGNEEIENDKVIAAKWE